MLCERPLRKGVLTYGCGQCPSCNKNKRREWTSRLLLERFHHAQACFATLTYNEDALPKDLCVSKRTAVLFLKRLRKSIEPRKIRYYLVGEYGTKYGRPHYHVILYGISPFERETIQKAWPYGFVHTGTAEARSFAYTSSYIVKKWTKKGDPKLKGRTPEFSLMSTGSKKEGTGGIGYKSAEGVIKAYKTKQGMAALEKNRWFETTWKLDHSHSYPYGRYINDKIQAGLGLTKEQKYRRNQFISARHSAKLAGTNASQDAYNERVKLQKQNNSTPSERTF